MKKLMTALAVASASLLFVGCGGKPKIPANTVAAAYVDLEDLADNALDVIDDAIDEIPNKEMRKEAREEFDKLVKEHKKDLKAVDAEWLVLTVGLDRGNAPEIAAVVKCDYNAKIPGANNLSLKECAAMSGSKVASKEKYETFRASVPVVGSAYVSFVDGKYIVVAEDEAVSEKIVALYADGKGETSDDFDDLTDIGGDTVARIQTAKVETFLKVTGGEKWKDVRKDIEKFFEDAGDEDLGDLLLDIGNVTLDINFSDDVLGYVLSVDAGSRKLAKVVESAFNVIAFASRVGTTVGTGVVTKFNPLLRQFGLAGQSETIEKAIKAIADQIRDAVDVDRSGSTATLTVEFDTDDLLEALVPALCQ